VRDRFDEFVAGVQKQAPETLWVRLDRVPELQSNEYYWDLLHLNVQGQEIATKTLLKQLAAAGIP
jgi:hypothetical protein